MACYPRCRYVPTWLPPHCRCSLNYSQYAHMAYSQLVSAAENFKMRELSDSSIAIAARIGSRRPGRPQFAHTTKGKETFGDILYNPAHRDLYRTRLQHLPPAGPASNSLPEKIHARLHAAPRLLVLGARHLGRSVQAAGRHSRVRLGRGVGELDDGHLFWRLVGHPVPALRLGCLGREAADGAADVVAAGVDLAGLAVLRGDQIGLLVETAPVADGDRIALDRPQGALPTALVTRSSPTNLKTSCDANVLSYPDTVGGESRNARALVARCATVLGLQHVGCKLGNVAPAVAESLLESLQREVDMCLTRRALRGGH